MNTEEDIPTFLSRVQECSRVLKATRPNNYSSSDLDDELVLSALLRGTPYTTLTTSLLAQDTLTVSKVEDALKNEEHHQKSAGTVTAASASTQGASGELFCEFCELKGSHVQKDCWKYKEAKSSLPTKEPRRFGGRRKGRANAVQDGEHIESAGAVSSLLSSPHSPLSDLWNADTGATLHMTPRREWFKDYKPSHVLIRVANDQLVRASGVGTVEFIPVKDGVSLRPLLFTGVLHVPDLAQNLFSVLTLTRKHKFRVLIDADTMSFLRDGVTHFHATICDSTVAYLSGSTVSHPIPRASPQGASAEAFAAGPKVDYDTWHRRLCHPGRDRTLRLLKEDLVLGLDSISVPSHPDLCTTCIAGKQTRLPFPSSETRSTTTYTL